MDAGPLTLVLAIAVIADAFAVAVLAFALIRSERRRAAGPGAAQRGTAAEGPVAGSVEPMSALAGGPAAAPGGSDDPLAASIEAFLSRREGLFRTVGAVPTSEERAEGAERAEVAEVAQGEGGGDGGPEPSSPRADRPVVIPFDAALRSGLPSTAQAADAEASPTVTAPIRYVVSGADRMAEVPPPAGSRGPDEGGRPAPPTIDPNWPPVAVAEIARAVRYGRAVCVVDLSIDPREEPAEEDRVALLGTVVGDLLRDRLRASDRVLPDGPAKFIVVLPETAAAGGAAVAARFRTTCDTWLGAEVPPLQLGLRVAEARDADAVLAGTPSAGASSPEPEPGDSRADRRRPTPPDA